MSEVNRFSAHNTQYAFGLTAESVASGLESMARDVRSGKWATLSVEFAEKLPQDDYAVGEWVLRLKIAEKT